MEAIDILIPYKYYNNIMVILYVNITYLLQKRKL